MSKTKVKDDIKYKKSKTRTKVLKIDHYRGCPVYIRQIGDSYFEWLIVYNNQIYTGYIEMFPAEGKKKLTKKEIVKTANIVFAGAVTTVDSLLFMEEEKKKEQEGKKQEHND